MLNPDCTPMTAAFFRRIARFRTRSAPPPERAAARIATPAVRISGPPHAAAITSEDPAEFRQSLTFRLERWCVMVRETVADSPDALALIESLEKPTGSMIRQPPAAAQRMLFEVRAREGSSSLLTKMIGADPTLAQALLRLTNSAVYATTGGPCVSISDAVRRLGATGVEGVVLRCMVEGMLCRPGGRMQAMVDRVWSHMVRTGPIGYALAETFGVNAEVGYSLALLHDIGKLIVFERVGALRHKLRRDPRFPDRFIETMLGALHEPLGGLAALEWGLGKPAAAAIASHHRTVAIPASDDASQLLYVAERVDLARTRGLFMGVQGWIHDGRLSVNQKEIEAIIGALPSPEQ
jgi:HD-like signal output (HDOD) protein